MNQSFGKADSMRQLVISYQKSQETDITAFISDLYKNILLRIENRATRGHQCLYNPWENLHPIQKYSQLRMADIEVLTRLLKSDGFGVDVSGNSRITWFIADTQSEM
jgi:hypothetical protein